ncbi:MAG: hypothetical protein AABX29_03790 [Nanoarchaeota archaeon]
MIGLVLFLILVLFFIFIFLKPYIVKLTGRFCSICASVSSTWIILLILKILNYNIDPLVVGILMGGSVVGIMYKFEDYAKKHNKKLLLFRIVILIIGFLIVYSLIKYLWGLT